MCFIFTVNSCDTSPFCNGHILLILFNNAVCAQPSALTSTEAMNRGDIEWDRIPANCVINCGFGEYERDFHGGEWAYGREFDCR